MSVTVGVPWSVPDDAKSVLKVCDEELRLCLDRSSDSDSQLELNRSLTDLIESITCKDDSGDEILTSVSCGREVVADIVERILDRVEETASSAPIRLSAELTDAREIDCERSRDKDNPRQEADPPRKAVRRKRDRGDHERKKSRRRSTSCSTTSSACSDISRKHRRKNKHQRRSEVEDPSPRVNPIFLWVKQDDTRIVEVLCEDYDKRNRIRLTKTAHGWRSTPRTERLDSALSRSSLDLPPTPPPLVSPVVVKTEPSQTKEKKTKRCISRKNKRCDKKKDKGFKKEVNYVDECKYVDVVNNNNNNCSISNNNKVKLENRLVKETSLSDSRLRSFGYKKACHEGLRPDNKRKTKVNKRLEDIDVYTFVSTPKTDSEFDDDNGMNEHSDSGSEPRLQVDLEIKQEPAEPLESDPNKSESESILENSNQNSAPDVTESKVEENADVVHSDASALSVNIETPNNQPDEKCKILVEETSSDIVPNSVNNTDDQLKEKDQDQDESVRLKVHDVLENNNLSIESEPLSLQLPPEKAPTFEEQVDEPCDSQQQPQPSNMSIDEKSPCAKSTLENIDDCKPNEKNEEPQEREAEVEQEADEEEEEPPPEVILPELHLQTPEPSPQPVPEPSSIEPESILAEISLQPDTSLDSDTIHLPDTTTKSDTALLINTSISLGQNLSLKPQPEITLGSSLLPETLHSDSKSEHRTDVALQPQHENKNASILHQNVLEREITADLDEDHLLAIEEILQGEECVEDFDDLPEEYSVSDDSPVNLVIDLKHKDQVDNTGIPLSLRTDDFLELFPTPLPMKEHPESLPLFTPPPKKQEPVEKPIPPAHQQSKTKFLESILSHPKKCHKQENKKSDSSDQQEPLYLGVSRKSASPTVSSSDGRKFSSPELEPKPKRMKVEDITLKTILNRNKEHFSKTKVNKIKDSDDTQQTADSTTKSRLMELLTNENDEHISKLDPLTQLKEVLSDPDLNVPDPLLVPRARLPALVANPAKEIPRLLAMKSENLSYPKLLTDPDLLVVSLSHLQTLLQAAGKDEEMLKYQQHAQLLQQQMKQEQTTLDAATATALNQMMWLPYLSQLEAAAVACGNTQDFMAMLNMVFPSGAYSQMNPYMMTSPSPGINAYDYKSQLEFQQAFALWNEAMMQAATNQFAAQTLGTTNNISTKLYQNYPETKYNPKQSHSNTSYNKHQETKHTSARTSPITLNYQQNKYRASQYPYTSMFSIPTSTPTTSHSTGTTYRTTPSVQSQSYQSRPRSYNYNNYASMRTTAAPSVPKVDHSSVNVISTSDLYKSQQKHSSSSINTSSSSCRSLMNILSKPPSKQGEGKSHVSKAYPTSTTMLPKETTLMLAPSSRPEPPKLKVKQPQHLVDPHSRPKLLNFDEHGEVGSTTGSLTPQVDETHPNLWHPLFSSHQQKSYSSPWQWTTPVTVSGE